MFHRLVGILACLLLILSIVPIASGEVTGEIELAWETELDGKRFDDRVPINISFTSPRDVSPDCCNWRFTIAYSDNGEDWETIEVLEYKNCDSGDVSPFPYYWNLSDVEPGQYYLKIDARYGDYYGSIESGEFAVKKKFTSLSSWCFLLMVMASLVAVLATYGYIRRKGGFSDLLEKF